MKDRQDEYPNVSIYGKGNHKVFKLCICIKNKAGHRFVGILRGRKGVWVSDKRLVLSRNQNTSIQFVYKFAPYINDKQTDKSCCFHILANTFLLSKDRLVCAIKDRESLRKDKA